MSTTKRQLDKIIQQETELLIAELKAHFERQNTTEEEEQESSSSDSDEVDILPF